MAGRRTRKQMDTNPENLPLTAESAEALRTWNRYSIHRASEFGGTYELRGRRGAVYLGIRNKHSGLIRFIEGPTQTRIDDSSGEIRIW